MVVAQPAQRWREKGGSLDVMMRGSYGDGRSSILGRRELTVQVVSGHRDGTVSALIDDVPVRLTSGTLEKLRGWSVRLREPEPSEHLIRGLTQALFGKRAVA